ncbi:hypothetical protein SteCoe_25531 [Stentor coeruleus]|uniref:Arf-GAP domain-containing protein n=1 Tax=Stentor coeruleus TaxID=5963 RepID=A0A1R2BFB4_9CILI|nr:hypothetical protein SteCoe_25531 [Stentor coeruleus]
MLSEESIYQEILKIRAQDKNSSCVDCFTANPEFISVTFGIFICQSCAKKHLMLGPSISRVISLTSNLSSEDLISIQSGGNSALLTFFNYYKISSFPIEYKYCTSAATFYQDMLKHISKGQDYPKDLLSIYEGQTLYHKIQENAYGIIEVEFNQNNQNPNLLNQNNLPESNPIPENSSSISSFFKNIGDNINNTFETVASTPLSTYFNNIITGLNIATNQIEIEIKEVGKDISNIFTE